MEVKSRFHTVRWFEPIVHYGDLFRAVVYCSYQGDPAKRTWGFSRELDHSCVSDLTHDMAEIAASMRKDTRNGVRRAEKEGCQFVVVDDLSEYVDYHNAFCKSKGLDNYVSLEKLRKYEKLLVSKVVHDGIVLSMHISILDEKGHFAISLYSSSCRLEVNADRKLIGWGNRLLRYKELEYLKGKGYRTYDWGGVCTDPNDPRYSIGEFKLSFGGTVVDSWTLKSPMFVILETIRGICVGALRVLGRWRSCGRAS